MTPTSTRFQPVVAQLREATMQMHLDLHEHPLIVELFAAPSRLSYEAVLKGFYSFYGFVEPRLVESAQRLEAAEQYSRQERTEWLVADLKALDHEPSEVPWPEITLPDLPFGEIGELVGCLYVVKGSALGGQTIFNEVRQELDVENCSRFLQGHGKRTALNWREFRMFCDNACRRPDALLTAVDAAKSTFRAIGDSLTWSWQEYLSGFAECRTPASQ